MPSAQREGYAPLLNQDVDADVHTSFDADRPLRRSVQAEFNRPPPAWWKRLLLLVGIVAMGWIVMYLGGMGRKKPQIIYASRYSEEFKYRPATSPVITEYLADGRIRLRGASPGGVGVTEEDLPMSDSKRKILDQKRREEARENARIQMGLKTKKQKLKAKAKKKEDEARKKVHRMMGKTDI